jgi:hypothetical protein
MRQFLDMAEHLGWWISRVGDSEWLFNPPGTHNTITRVVESPDGPGLAVDEFDQERIVASVRDARSRADLLVVHVHNHEWEPALGITSPPQFMRDFARAVVAAGADVVLIQGSHVMRGMEICDSKPVFYDPGDFLGGVSQIARLPGDFYDRHRQTLGVDPYRAMLSDGLKARSNPVFSDPVQPPGGYGRHTGGGSVLPMLSFGSDGRLEDVTLHPCAIQRFPKVSQGLSGMPFLIEEEEQARAFIESMASLSEPFGDHGSPQSCAR